uniref:PLC n=1 Tax=Arundo donax TaxID=35708 RepID=A0A0A9DGY4_ARUDO
MGGLRSGEKRNPKKSSSVGGDGAGDLVTKRAIPAPAPPPVSMARMRSMSAGDSPWTWERKRRRPSLSVASEEQAEWWAARTSGGGWASGDRNLRVKHIQYLYA